MAEIKRHFLAGKMELDLDDRLVPEGVYREAYNVAISRSDTANVGALENLRGNRIVPSTLSLTESYEVIGSVVDNLNDRIYWFFVGPGTEGIYEFDFATGEVNRILEFSRRGKFLNFNVSHYVTGANVIENLLYWTDGLNPPRKINIDRFRGTALDPKIDNLGLSLVDLTNVELTEASVTVSPPFLGDLINVGKRPPLFPPILNRVRILIVDINGDAVLDDNGNEQYEPAPVAESGDNLYDNFISFAYRYKYRDGEITPLSPFTPPAFFPKKRNLTRASSGNLNPVSFSSMTNSYNQIEIKYDPGEQEVTEVEIVLKYSNNANLYSLVILNKSESDIPHSTPYERRYQPFTYSDNKVYRVLPSDQLTRIFDNVPLKAKAQEITANRLVFGNYTENYNLKYLSESGPDLVPDFTVANTTIDRDIRDDFATCTVKSDRDYEVGIVYMDREGRQTPVLLSQNSSINIPFSNNGNRNLLNVTIRTPSPYWATHYRFFIKQSQGGFYNIFPTFVEKDVENKRLYVKLDQGEISESLLEADQPLRSVDINKAKVGDKVVLKGNATGIQTIRREFLVEQVNPSRTKIIANTSITGEDNNDLNTAFLVLSPINTEDIDVFAGTGEASRDYQVILETVPVLDSNLNIYAEYGKTFRCTNGAHTTATEEIISASDTLQDIYSQLDAEVINGEVVEGDARDSISVPLEYFNCFSYTNGIEEINILGDFNSPTFPAGIKFSTVDEEYRQREQQAHLIHSGIFNDDVNLNRFNEFNTSNLIFNELDISNGSIQKLHFRDTNLIVFQEDKVLNVPINKNLIQTAGGTPGLSTASTFFGTERSYDGEYGISLNPESFATYGSRIYFVDKNRGVMLRLAGNGLEELSKKGVESRFRDDVAQATLVIGSYDDFHDQYLCTLRNRPSQPIAGLEGNQGFVQLSDIGCPDPRAECNRDLAFIRFRQLYSIEASPRTGLQFDDMVFTDPEYTIPFNGNYRWYRQRDENDPSDTNAAVQISPYGGITGITRDCLVDFPEQDRRIIFNISKERFNDEFDACANGIVDSVAWHDGAETEPNNDSLIYEGPLEIAHSTRTGWYIITEGNEKYVINIDNGIVINKLNCDIISRGRRRIVASNILEISSGISEFRRNVEICNAPFAESVIWFTSDNSLPEVGDIVHENNINEDVVPVSLTTNDTYYSSEEGYFIRVDTVSDDDVIVEERGLTRVLEVGFCSQTVCLSTPNDLFTQSTNDIFSFTFSGIAATYRLTTIGRETTELSSLQAIPNAEITYFVHGNNTYGPLVVNTEAIGFYDFTTVQDGSTPDTFTIDVGETFALPAPNDAIFASENASELSVTIAQVCYRGATSDVVFERVFAVPFLTDSPTTCGLSASNALYYDPNILPVRYFNTQGLNEDFDSGAGQYGISAVIADSGGAVSRIETISATGVVEDAVTVFCVAPYLYNLGYTEGTSTDLRQAACNAPMSTPVAADRPRAGFSHRASDPVTTLYTPNSLARANPGFYTDGINLRRQENGVLGDNDEQGCSFIDPLLPVDIDGVTTADEDTDVTLTATSSEAGVTWLWSEVTNGTLVSGGGTSNEIVITRTDPGTASVTVTGSKGGFRDNDDTHSITFEFVAPPPEDPTVTLTTSDATAQTGETVTLTAVAASFTGTVLATSFVFQGSTNAINAVVNINPDISNSVQITFTEPLNTEGAITYRVTTTVGMEEATDTVPITWGAAPPDPEVTIAEQPSIGTVGTNITLTASSNHFTSGPDLVWTGGAAAGLTGGSITFTEAPSGGARVFNQSYGVTATRGAEEATDSHIVRWTEAAPPTPSLSFTLVETGPTGDSEPYEGGSQATFTASNITRTDTGAAVTGVTYAWVTEAENIVSGGGSSSSLVLTGTDDTVNVQLTISKSGFNPDTETGSAVFGGVPFAPNGLTLFAATTQPLACAAETGATIWTNAATLASSSIIYKVGGSAPTSDTARHSFNVYLRQSLTDATRFWDGTSLAASVDCPESPAYQTVSLRFSATSDGNACNTGTSAVSVFVNPYSTFALGSVTTLQSTAFISTATAATVGFYSTGTQYIYWDGTTVSTALSDCATFSWEYPTGTARGTSAPSRSSTGPGVITGTLTILGVGRTVTLSLTTGSDRDLQEEVSIEGSLSIGGLSLDVAIGQAGPFPQAITEEDSGNLGLGTHSFTLTTLISATASDLGPTITVDIT